MRIGFLGLGTLGRPMMENLHRRAGSQIDPDRTSLALGAARDLGLAVPNTAIARQMFQAATANGLADADHSALATALELLAGTKRAG